MTNCPNSNACNDLQRRYPIMDGKARDYQLYSSGRMVPVIFITANIEEILERGKKNENGLPSEDAIVEVVGPEKEKVLYILNSCPSKGKRWMCSSANFLHNLGAEFLKTHLKSAK